MIRSAVPAHLRTGAEEQAETRRIFAAAGGRVYQTSDPRARRPDPGIPDKLIVFPNRLLLLGWDDKAGCEQYPPTDVRRLSPEQLVFGRWLGLGLRTDFAWGDAAAAVAWLRGLK